MVGTLDEQMREVNAALLISSVRQHELAEDAQKAEIRYRRLFETAQDGILILDIHTGAITDANPYMRHLLGHVQAGFMHKRLWEIGVFADKKTNEAALRELLKTGYLHHENLTLQTSTGEPVEVELVANVYTEGHQRVIQCNIRDISDRRKAERDLIKSLTYAEGIIATLREPFVVLDSDLRVRTANRAFYDSFHVLKDETENRLVFDLGNGQWDIPALRSLLEKVLSRSQSVFDFEVEHSFPTLGRKHMLLNARPFPAGTKYPELILLAVEDVTATRQRVDELALASRNKDEFLATLAHELRNPLAPIRNAVHTLGLDGLKETDARTARDIIDRQVSIMVRLIDDLLDMSRVGSNKLHVDKQRVDLTVILESVLESSFDLIEKCGHELTISLPLQSLHIDADPIRFSQILLNLLNNAAKYTNPGGQIWLTAGCQGTDAVISIRDNGLGIPSDMLVSIFDMFTQVDRSLTQSRGGLGIGLTLVRKLVEMHDGTIEARSNGLDQGSEFIVRVPLSVAPSQQLPPPPSEPQPTAISGWRIVVVDDNKDSANTLAMLLRHYDNMVATAHDGLEALETVESFQPQLVLLDIGLPKLDGHEVARRIRQQPWGREMILVALTGWGQEEDKKRSQEAGFNHHIVKPVNFAALNTLLIGQLRS